MAQPIKMQTSLSLFFTIFIMMTAFMAFLIIIYYQTHQTIVIETKLGKIIGTSVTRINKKVNCFFGIPYAEPPIGDLRFRKPVPKKPWNLTLKALKPPNFCWQSDKYNWKNSSWAQKLIKYSHDLERYFLGQHVSEDCLYLNIFVNNNEPKNKTVMVWIHGGAFLSGSISEAYYDGSALAAHNDVIVVAIAYRLGVFGFLAAEDTDLIGNYGLFDQVMALQWVKDNIHAFGGNPNNIVLFGESAGAESVGYHLISPLSQHLFNRAILESGNALVPQMLASKSAYTSATIDLVQNLSCSLPRIYTNASQLLDETSILCLRQANASTLYELSREIMLKIPGVFFPLEGNEFFAEHPLVLVKKRQFYLNKEILIGTNDVEGAYFSRYGPLKRYWFGDKIDSNFTKETILQIMNSTIPETYSQYTNLAIDYALEGLTNTSDPVEVWNRYVKLIGDIIFVCPDFVFINEYSASNRTVYYYRFRPKQKYNSWSPTWATGAIHGEEIPFVFGIPLLLSKYFTLKEIKLSEIIMNVWTNFAKTGIPSGSGNAWHPYTVDKPKYMSFDVTDIHMNEGFPGLRCGQYFELLINQLRNYLKSGAKVPI